MAVAKVRDILKVLKRDGWWLDRRREATASFITVQSLARLRLMVTKGILCLTASLGVSLDKLD
jgi:hypothetical protein